MQSSYTRAGVAAAHSCVTCVISTAQPLASRLWVQDLLVFEHRFGLAVPADPVLTPFWRHVLFATCMHHLSCTDVRLLPACVPSSTHYFHIESQMQHATPASLPSCKPGPVTILNWSFPRKDISRAAQAAQLALALRQEVDALQTAGCRIIQVSWGARGPTLLSVMHLLGQVVLLPASLAVPETLSSCHKPCKRCLFFVVTLRQHAGLCEQSGTPPMQLLGNLTAHTTPNSTPQPPTCRAVLLPHV